jgi:catechol 2,3-dioxygenase-like lactoylglutathione lyase family enzyme
LDRANPNLPSANLDRTADFYRRLGFAVGFKDDGWMILDRGPITLEFLPVAVDPRTTTGSACLRVDDLDALHAAFGVVGQLPRFCRTTPGVLPIQEAHGLRMFVLIDLDGNLLRCLDNLYGAG